MRGKRAPKRDIQPDEVYGSQLVSKFINYTMFDGRKATARLQVYKAIEDASTKTKTKGAEVLERAIENIKPKLEVRSRRIGGANFQVPVPVSQERQVALACKWLIEGARKSRKNQEYWEVLSKELISAFNKEGTAMKKKDEVMRMAEANKAFAQFA
jgi:small subunit ribosomal protein S7